MACSKSVIKPVCEDVEVCLDDIPKYLQTGLLYQTMMENDEKSNTTITIPSDCIKLNSLVESAEDFEALLRAIQFWIVPEDINCILDYAFNSLNTLDFIEVCQKYDRNLPKVASLRAVVETTEVLRMQVAAEHGLLNVMQYLMSFSEDTNFDFYDVCTAASINGHLDCLQYAHQQGCPWGVRVSCAAAASGMLHCLEYLKEKGCPLSSRDRMDVLTSACVSAATNNQLSCLRYLRDHGCEWDASLCAEAALRGNLPCLKNLHEHGCPWDTDVIYFAVLKGHLNCLQYAHEQQLDGLKDAQLCFFAAHLGRLECLQYLHEQGYPWNAGVCESAAQGGHLKCLQYAHEHGCEWTAAAAFAAATKGHAQCLQYLKDHGCPGASGQVLSIRAVVAEGAYSAAAGDEGDEGDEAGGDARAPSSSNTKCCTIS